MKDEVIHSYPMYVADWLRSETRIKLSSAGRGMIRELFDYCWIEGTLPNDPRALLAISGGTQAEFDAEWPIMAECFTVDGNRLRHWKVDDKRPDLVGYRRQRSKAGKASVDARRERALKRSLNERSNENGTGVETTVERVFKPSVSVSVSSTVSAQNPLPPFQQSQPPAAIELTPDDVGYWVDLIVEMYPSPADARSVYRWVDDNDNRLSASGRDRFLNYMTEVQIGLEEWVAYWETQGNQFVPDVMKWLHGTGWKKHPPKPKPIPDGPILDGPLYDGPLYKAGGKV